MGIVTVLWEKWAEFKRDFYKITLSAMISPLLYLIVFGMGIKTTSHGEPYINFLIPGLIAMSTMTGSFGAVAQNMSVQRLYEKALDQIMVSPTPLWQFITGQIIGGSLRGIYSAAMILLLTFPLKTGLVWNGWSLLVMFLNGTVFATIALTLSFMAKSYTDMPNGFRQFISVLPLSKASEMLRSISRGEGFDAWGIVILAIYLVVFSLISMNFIYKKKNL